MNQGKVEQISAPYELHTRPQSLFVAQFIGRNTIIPGTVKGIAGQQAVLDTPFGGLAGAAPSQPATRGAKASLVLPAEAIDILAAGACVISGTIARVQQVGHLVQMSVTLPNGETINVEGHAGRGKPTKEKESG